MTNNQVGIYHRTVDYALDILEQFNGNVGEFNLTELSNNLNINKNTVFRILTTLEFGRYISKNTHNAGYRLGPKAVAHGQTFKNQMALLRKAKPIIEELVNTCNESSFVAIQKNFQIIFLDTVETNHAVRVVPRLGVQLPLHCTAAGKLLLAYMSEWEQEKYLSSHELKRYTPNTITDKDILRNHLSRVAELGYAASNEELDSGVRCVSAPVRDYKRRFIGAVSISGPSMRFSVKRIALELIPLVRKAAEDISLSHGFPREPVASCLPDITFDSVINFGISDSY